MNYALVFVLSILDAIAILPFNSELSFLYTVKQKKYSLKKYLGTSLVAYVLPSMLGTIIAYFIGWFFSHSISRYIEFLLSSIFILNIKITPANLLTTLVFKIFMPILPISLVNLLCGIYAVNLTHFLLISLILRLARVMFIYNAVLFADLYPYIALVFYTGIFGLCSRIALVMFYRSLFIQ